MNRLLSNSLSSSDNNRRSAPVRPSRSQQVIGPSPSLESLSEFPTLRATQATARADTGVAGVAASDMYTSRGDGVASSSELVSESTMHDQARGGAGVRASKP